MSFKMEKWKQLMMGTLVAPSLLVVIHQTPETTTW